ncbi:vacuolar protein sorting-associated protein 32 homolog 2 [Eucalyptus grandis]|nr:vacuolar protein sorting-associated protein 32 homolog 2 [Eucalyptus grandis]XP_010047643.1 vacuolar protein sorting-associated protein 32 homolog 2 [Eucalyptus grandis]XP_018725366.1 vacuolar protein sorting-associated protein 32 homolog 2 [Eucalyptus grandis]
MFGWMCRLFKKLKLGIDAQPLTPRDKLKKTLEKLKKKAQTYKKKASQEVKKAKKSFRARDRGAANLCLKRKSLYEQQIELLGNSQFQIEELIIKLEGVKTTTETVDALKIGAAAMQEMQKATNIDDGDKNMDETKEVMTNVKLIQASLRTPSGAATEFNEDKVEAKLKEREGADPVPQRTAEKDELADSQAEMAL